MQGLPHAIAPFPAHSTFTRTTYSYLWNVVESSRLGRRGDEGEDINRGHLRLLARRHKHQCTVRIGQTGNARVNRLAHGKQTGSGVIDVEGVHTDLYGIHLHRRVEAEQALVHVQPAGQGARIGETGGQSNIAEPKVIA